MTDQNKEKKEPQLHFNDGLNVIWVDTLNFAMRSDENVLMRFLTNLPDGNFEQFRVMTGKTNLIQWIDLICSQLNYYPKADGKKGTPKKLKTP